MILNIVFSPGRSWNNKEICPTVSDRISFLTEMAATDVGPDFSEGTADDDTVGPFFLVKGNIVAVDGEPTEGFFICRGLILSDTGRTSFPFGLTQVSQTFIIKDRGIIYADGIEFLEPGFAPCRIVGGTGEFERVRGVYMQEGAPFPISVDGKIKFTFFLEKPKRVRR